MAKNLLGFACLVILLTDWDPMVNDHPFAPPFGIICLELFPYCQKCKTKTVITFLTGNAWRREVPPPCSIFCGASWTHVDTTVDGRNSAPPGM